MYIYIYMLFGVGVRRDCRESLMPATATREINATTRGSPKPRRPPLTPVDPIPLFMARSAVPCSQETCFLSLVVPTGTVLIHPVLSCRVHGDSSYAMEANPSRLPLLSRKWVLRDHVRAPDVTSCPEWTSASELSPRRACCSRVEPRRVPDTT